MHAGPTLLAASLNRRYYITGCRKIVRSITRGSITCRRTTAKPKSQVLGQLPVERITPDSVFDRVGLDYVGPFTVKYGSTCKPTLVFSSRLPSKQFTWSWYQTSQLMDSLPLYEDSLHAEASPRSYGVIMAQIS
jgi:hypothetical protein